MPRPGLDTVLQRALSRAVLDRESLAEAYSHKGPEAEAATAAALAIEALRGKKYRSMDEAERKTAFRALVYAESWEQSLGESQDGTPEGAEAYAEAKVFRTVRLAHIGRSAYEAAVAEGKSVPLHEILATPAQTSRTPKP